MSTRTTTSQPTQFKVCLLGAGATGKTKYVHRLILGNYQDFNGHIPTLGVEVHPLTLTTTRSTGMHKIVFNVWDCAGLEKYGGLRDGYYLEADAAIFFHSLDEKEEKDAMESQFEAFRRINPKAHVVHVIAKFDQSTIDTPQERATKREKRADKLLDLEQTHETEYVTNISSLSGFRIYEPFRQLAIALLNKSILFIEETRRPPAISNIASIASMYNAPNSKPITMEMVHQLAAHGLV